MEYSYIIFIRRSHNFNIFLSFVFFYSGIQPVTFTSQIKPNKRRTGRGGSWRFSHAEKGGCKVVLNKLCCGSYKLFHTTLLSQLQVLERGLRKTFSLLSKQTSIKLSLQVMNKRLLPVITIILLWEANLYLCCARYLQTNINAV